MTIPNKNDSQSGISKAEIAAILIFVIALHGAALYFLFADTKNSDPVTHQKTALGAKEGTVVDLTASSFSPPPPAAEPPPPVKEMPQTPQNSVPVDQDALEPAKVNRPVTPPKPLQHHEERRHDLKPVKPMKPEPKRPPEHEVTHPPVRHTIRSERTTKENQSPATKVTHASPATRHTQSQSSSPLQSTNGIAVAKGTANGTPGAGDDQITPAVSGMQSLGNPPPDYPVLAIRRQQEGTVVLRIQVLANGTAGSVTIEKSSNYEYLDDAAVDTVKKWHFIPARRGNVPIEGFAEQTITFRLPDS